ncbi:glucosaminidase domain-containing protein [Gilvimarinus agarilyticus]|uniref:glucosaminidase domain-containing protein n=1 Tax=Gilvimarinus agarilyticus TaxID=679259 RepID=UPI0006981FA8|nr:glucosaminidase domain-containing protein [Gilvimarinus agarilyticus]
MQQRKFQLIAAALVIYALGTLALALFFASTHYKPASLGSISGDTVLPNMRAIDDIPTRKQTFIQLIAPMASAKNDAIMQARARLTDMLSALAQGKALSYVQKEQLRRLGKRYQVDTDAQAAPQTQQIKKLLRRVDVIPTSMVVAQAATESGWGTSRFARQAQNLFGQWCYTKGCGLVPKSRNKGATHEVQKFPSLEQAVNAYYHNINTHRTYAAVRSRRAALRDAGQPITGPELIPGLVGYSSRGQVYVDELGELIRYNKLELLDQSNALPSEH